MNLLWVVATPLLGALGAWASSKLNEKAARWIAVASMVTGLFVMLSLWSSAQTTGPWVLEWQQDWLTSMGASIHFGVDGLSYVLIVLTYALSLIALLFSWNTQTKASFHVLVLLLLAGVSGVLLSLDLFVFFVFWEVMLIPLYFLILLFGEKNRQAAATQFLIFTQSSGLLLLLGILALYFAHYDQTGVFTFDYDLLKQTMLGPQLGLWIFAAFLIAFLVKLPIFPLHTWFVDIFAEGPVAALLIGILVKTGAYGLIRFVLPLFPGTSAAFSPFMLALGVVTLIYGALLAFSQHEGKKVLAYSTVSHMGLVVIGIFCQNPLAQQGVILLLVTQALSTGGLLMVLTLVEQFLPNKKLFELGGLYGAMPKMAVVAWFFIMATVGLPGLGNFVGEFHVLGGAFVKYKIITALATSGLVLGAVYSLWLMQRVFFGEQKATDPVVDLSSMQVFIFACMILALVCIGLYPSPLIKTLAEAIS